MSVNKEQVGQYYFDIEKTDFVNKGKMIEIDERGHKRWPSWKSWGWGIGFIALPIVAGYGGMGAVYKLGEQIAARTNIASVIDERALGVGFLGLIAVGAVGAMGATLMSLELLSDKIRQSTRKLSFNS